MSEQKRVIYTKEELAAKVKVPAIVEQDLKRITDAFPESRQLLLWLINLL